MLYVLQIDLATFLTLTDDDLKELGIKTFGARRKMLLAIAGLLVAIVLAKLILHYVLIAVWCHQHTLSHQVYLYVWLYYVRYVMYCVLCRPIVKRIAGFCGQMK